MAMATCLLSMETFRGGNRLPSDRLPAGGDRDVDRRESIFGDFLRKPAGTAFNESAGIGQHLPHVGRETAVAGQRESSDERHECDSFARDARKKSACPRRRCQAAKTAPESLRNIRHQQGYALYFLVWFDLHILVSCDFDARILQSRAPIDKALS